MPAPGSAGDRASRRSLGRQTQIRLVDERGRLERVVLAFAPQLGRGTFPQRSVDERQQIVLCSCGLTFDSARPQQ
jgi:hypothetical protein